MTRIRYSKPNQENIIRSVKTFQHPDNGARYAVLINTKELSFTVIEDSSNTTVDSGRAVNLHQVKIKAKKALETLGVPFEAKETRAVKAKEQVA